LDLFHLVKKKQKIKNWTIKVLPPLRIDYWVGNLAAYSSMDSLKYKLLLTSLITNWGHQSCNIYEGDTWEFDIVVRSPTMETNARFHGLD
jgi:hypothetical protein